MAADWSGLSGERLIESAKAKLWEPARAARAAQLWHEPTPVDTIVQFGRYLGVDLVTHPRLAWLVDVAFAAEPPAGWVRVEHSDGRIYYSNAVCGLAQWEHPMVSYLTGVAGELVKADGLGELERLPMRRECGPRKGGGDVSGGRGAPLTLTARLESRVGSLGLPDAVA